MSDEDEALALAAAIKQIDPTFFDRNFLVICLTCNAEAMLEEVKPSAASDWIGNHFNNTGAEHTLYKVNGDHFDIRRKEE
jgi:hypothetical protein